MLRQMSPLAHPLPLQEREVFLSEYHLLRKTGEGSIYQSPQPLTRHACGVPPSRKGRGKYRARVLK